MQNKFSNLLSLYREKLLLTSLSTILTIIVFLIFKSVYERIFINEQIIAPPVSSSVLSTLYIQDINHDNIDELFQIDYDPASNFLYLYKINVQKNHRAEVFRYPLGLPIYVNFKYDLNNDYYNDLILIYETSNSMKLFLYDIVNEKILQKDIKILNKNLINKKNLAIDADCSVFNNTSNLYISLSFDTISYLYKLNISNGKSSFVTFKKKIESIISFSENNNIYIIFKEDFFDSKKIKWRSKIDIYDFSSESYKEVIDTIIFPSKILVKKIDKMKNSTDEVFLIFYGKKSTNPMQIFEIHKTGSFKKEDLATGNLLKIRAFLESNKYVFYSLLQYKNRLIFLKFDQFFNIINKKILFSHSNLDLNKKQIYFCRKYILYFHKNILDIYSTDQNSTLSSRKVLRVPYFIQKFLILSSQENTFYVFPKPFSSLYIKIQFNTFPKLYYVFLPIIFLLSYFISKLFFIALSWLIISIKVLQYFVTKSPKGILILDLSGRIVHYNLNMIKILDKFILKTLQKNEPILSILDQNSEIYHNVYSLVKKHKSFTMSLKIHLNDQKAEVLYSGDILTFFKNMPLGSIIEATNISNLVTLEREDIWHRSFRKTISLIETPLTNIMINNTALSIYLNDRSRRIQRKVLLKHVDNIQQSIQSIQSIRNKLEKVTKIKSFSRTPILVEELIQRSLNKFSHYFEDKIELLLNFENNLPAISVDVELMQMAIENVIENSIDSMNGKGIIHISCNYINYPVKNFTEALEITISDTGTGIGREYIPFVCEPYFSTKPFGTGLGLAITSKIIREHGGEVLFNSTVNVGTTVTIIIPY